MRDLEVVGQTPEGKSVVRGVFSFYETHGISFDALFDALAQRGMIPDWPSLVEEAVSAGMKPSRIISTLSPAIADSFGPSMRDVVVSRLLCLYP